LSRYLRSIHFAQTVSEIRLPNVLVQCGDWPHRNTEIYWSNFHS